MEDSGKIESSFSYNEADIAARTQSRRMSYFVLSINSPKNWKVTNLLKF